MNATNSVLLLTVGTGDENNREESLFKPLRLSIAQGSWSVVILLPSHVSEGWAEEVSRGLAPLNIQVHPLPHPGDEDNADRCFDHFDRIMADLLAQGIGHHQIEVDPTRGTKMMSAALTLAAVRREVSRLRYITGERDQRGMVIAGTERIATFQTTRIHASLRSDDAYHLFQHGNFSAVLDMLPDPANPLTSLLWPPEFYPRMRAIRELARFYLAWDRLNYLEAHQTPTSVEGLPQEWVRFTPSLAVREWVKRLAAPFPDGQDEEECRTRQKAPYLLRLAVDLWGNGLRRIRAGQWEDATVRAYRVLEMIGQMRLFEQGHDSARLDPHHSRIQGYIDKIAKSNDKPLSRNQDGTCMAPRERVAGLLRHLGDQMGKKLIDLGNDSLMSTNARNHSILIHGFQAKAPEGEVMKKYYQRLEQELLRPCLEENRQEWLTLAMTPHFST